MHKLGKGFLLIHSATKTTQSIIELHKVSSNMSFSKLARVSKQHEKTWCDLHRRLISVPFSFEDVFTEPVYEFIKNKAIALSTSIGYMAPCLLTTTACICSIYCAHESCPKKCKIDHVTISKGASQ